LYSFEWDLTPQITSVTYEPSSVTISGLRLESVTTARFRRGSTVIVQPVASRRQDSVVVAVDSLEGGAWVVKLYTNNGNGERSVGQKQASLAGGSCMLTYARC
jgi:hypothetical protein